MQASIIILGLAFSSLNATAEPLRLFVESASADTDLRTGGPIVTVRLTDDSDRLFAKFTVTNLGRAIDIRIDDKSISKPVVRDPIMGGHFQFAVSNPEQAQGLAASLSDQTARLEVEAVSK